MAEELKIFGINTSLATDLCLAVFALPFRTALAVPLLQPRIAIIRPVVIRRPPSIAVHLSIDFDGCPSSCVEVSALMLCGTWCLDIL